MGAVHRDHESENNWGEGMKLEKALTFKLQSWRGSVEINTKIAEKWLIVHHRTAK